MSKRIHPDLLAAIAKVNAKRPRTVIDHILKHGRITTQELRDDYGYNHPPRAARDVREAGIPLKTVRVRGSDGRMIGAYEFGDPAQIEKHKLAGRRTFSKAFKKALVALSGSRCGVCGTTYPDRYLQIDHRVPYEVAGDEVAGEDSPDQFMLLCGQCQRAKSWTCEHCSNWTGKKRRRICETCYWAAPGDYRHVAGNEERRLALTFVGDEEVATYDGIARAARRRRLKLAEFVKGMIRALWAKLRE